MDNSQKKLRVILIGGTSHTGKSTLAQSLAAKLNGEYLSTDTLARHPGRPWKTPPDRVPSHVAGHYRSLSIDELITDVLRHYHHNVWPQVKTLATAHINDPSTPPLILEGSALWPEWTAEIVGGPVSALWLTADDSLLQDRIYGESHYWTKNPEEKLLIDKFLSRTQAYNKRMIEIISRLGFTSIDVGKHSSLEQLAALLPRPPDFQITGTF